LIPFSRYREVLSLVEDTAESLGWVKGTKDTENIFRISILKTTLRITVLETYRERSQVQPTPVIFLEDENDAVWYAKICFGRMSNELIVSCLKFYVKQFRSKNS
jgi:hypothetical protein